MKTALTELVEEFEKEFNDPDWQGMETKIWREAIKMLKEKLPQERQQIEDAYDQGNWDAASHKPDVINGKIYFTHNYEQ
jgi:hypothetical protein